MASPELLMPAGDFEKLRFALAFGADAVYLGIPRYSLRARENGFKTLEQVKEAVDYVHQLGKKVYVTANIFAQNNKVSSFTKHISDLLALCRPYAWVMSDPGLIMLMREHFPQEVIHLSVQANVLNAAAAAFWQKQGVRRIIVSREITIKDMKEIHTACPDLELESFVHGAICVAYSGRCLISNYLTSRDSNQGVCTNSCRWEYKIYQKPEEDQVHQPPKGEFYLEESTRPDQLFELDEDEHGSYLLNSKDLCAIQCLEELMQAGVCSFKVEGRSKSVYYVAMIARAYRQAIDDLVAGQPFNPKHMNDVAATSNRGFIDGFLHGNPGTAGQEYQSSHSAYSKYRFVAIVKGYDASTQRLTLEVRNPLKAGQTLQLCTPVGDEVFTVDKVFNHEGESVTQLHGGAGSCSIIFPKDPGSFALLRESLVESKRF